MHQQQQPQWLKLETTVGMHQTAFARGGAPRFESGVQTIFVCSQTVMD